MKRLFLYCVLALAGCGGDAACRCAGDIPGGHLDLACGKSQCLGGVGYRCAAANQLGPDATVCTGGTPDLGNPNPNPSMNPSGCTEGDPCVIDECNYGVIHCASGSSECQPVGSYTDGTACSTGTCQQGTCSACSPGAACSPDSCHTGYTECDSNGNASCIATATLSTGTTCGTGKVCSAGSCVACNAGASCSAGSECVQGVISCTSGAPYCLTSYKPNGTVCESNKVCDNGTCIPCVEGAACTPNGTCHTGTLHCGSGLPTCTDMGGSVSDGTSCSTTSGYVCKSGTCNYCSYPGASCQLDNKCKTAQISCDTGSAVCNYTGGNVTDGTSCGTDAQHVCSGGTCTLCKSGVACTPANPCHKGVTSCSTGTSVCVDQSTLAADGTNCGTNMFCKTGVCGACTENAACSTGDPCQTGKTTCATGTSVCVPSGATGASTCGNVTKGTCVSGACQCPAGSGFYNGDCQTCAAATSSPVVNANPSVGADNQCCGRSNTAGFGGPCLTIGQALANFPSSSITVSGDPQGNVSSAEKYPVHLTKSASITASGTVCLPGTSGKPVVTVDGNVSTASAVYYFTIGTDCAGNSGGASDGIYVGPGGIAVINGTIRKTVNGVHVDTGTVSASGLTVDTVSGEGVLCRSDSSATTSTFGNGGYYATINIAGAAKHDIFASTGCSISLGTQANLGLGDTWPCPTNKRDTYGLYAEGNAIVSLVGAGRASCMTNDGISLRNNAGLSTNAPTVSLGTSSYVWNIAHNGCAGLYAEVGTLSAYHATIESNHWGVVQHSASSGATALVNLSSGSNTLACNTSAEPGACSSAGAGADLFNNSGLPLDASGNKWQDSPITVCNCNSQEASCACTPGGSTPPDGIDVLNAPLSAGTPTTTLTNFTASTVTCL
jgi:hypothetical protein